MFRYRFNRMERWWLLALRLAWQYRSRPCEAARLIDKLLEQAGLTPCARDLQRLLAALQDHGADHLYIERFDQPGVTGDERDLIRALGACYLDDLLAAESELGALLPPGRTAEVVAILADVARAHQSCRVADAPTRCFPASVSTAACH